MTSDLRKGARTAHSILDAAGPLFARNGYAGTSLRSIALAAGLQEPGIYNHFDSKQAIYTAVLQRMLDPIGAAMTERINKARSLPDFIELPALLIDLLAVQPHVAALLQRSLCEDAQVQGNEVFHRRLDDVFEAGMKALTSMTMEVEVSRDILAINCIAIFNLVTGYFVAQPGFDTLAAGDVCSQQNIARQKQLVHRVIRAMMVS